MGYRSSLYIKLTNDLAPEFYAIVLKYELTDRLTNVHQGPTYFSCEFHDLNWYSDCPEVEEINNFIHTHGLQGKAAMLRDGEENGDIEEYGDFDSLGLWYWQSVVVEDLHEGDPGLDKLKASNPELFI